MKLVQVAEQNKRYYTKEFIHGFNTGAKTQYEADSKELRGRWIVRNNDYIDDCECSECGCVEYFNKGWKRFNYCPNCGARMEETE